MEDKPEYKLKAQMEIETESDRKKRLAPVKKKKQKTINYFEKILLKTDAVPKKQISCNQLKALVWKIGKEYFRRMDRTFIVDDHNREFLDVLCKYFSNDPSFEKVTDGELRKGLFIHGPCGTGKSSLLDIIREISQTYHLKHLWFSNVSVHFVVKEFNQHGEDIVDKYSRGAVHFDDLGTEKQVQTWGVKENLFERLLQIRYNNFKEKGTRTFVTSNLPIAEMKKIYGKQVYDRIFEMFNFIELSGESRRW